MMNSSRTWEAKLWHAISTIWGRRRDPTSRRVPLEQFTSNLSTTLQNVYMSFVAIPNKSPYITTVPDDQSGNTYPEKIKPFPLWPAKFCILIRAIQTIRLNNNKSQGRQLNWEFHLLQSQWYSILVIPSLWICSSNFSSSSPRSLSLSNSSRSSTWKTVEVNFKLRLFIV